MNTIVLLVERVNTWNPEDWTLGVGGQHVGEQVTLEQDGEWLSIMRDDQVLEDFDDAERARLSELVSAPMAYVIAWRGGKLVERLLSSIPPGARVAVDNDHGLLASFDQIAGKPLDAWVRAAQTSG